jgi:hypothetical protein
MKIIYNTHLFNRLKSISALYSDDGDWEREIWLGLFNRYNEIIDEDLPIFHGGLSNIEETRNQFVFYDIGCNDKNNSFIVRKEKV